MDIRYPPHKLQIFSECFTQSRMPMHKVILRTFIFIGNFTHILRTFLRITLCKIPIGQKFMLCAFPKPYSLQQPQQMSRLLSTI
jgi:hypothetical protein